MNIILQNDKAKAMTLYKATLDDNLDREHLFLYANFLKILFLIIAFHCCFYSIQGVCFCSLDSSLLLLLCVFILNWQLCVSMCATMCFWPGSVKDTENKMDTFVPGDGGITIQVWHDGRVQRSPSFLLSSSCMISIQYFPFDTQKCPIIVSTWSYTAHTVGAWNKPGFLL